MFTFSFHTILHAERNAYDFERRHKPTHTQIAIIRRFQRILGDISFPFVIFRRLDATFTALYVQNVVHMISSIAIGPETRKSQSFVDFEEV